MNALVTGGGGFLGRALVEALLAEGHRVRAASRRVYPELQALGAESVVCDVADAAAVRGAVAGCDTVFHAAALAGVWGPRRDYWRTNVEGTRHVLEACLEQGVPRLVYTSSPSVCFDGTDHVQAGNDLPHAARFLAAYPETKAVAEREVLEASGRGAVGTLATCALRPHLVIGPRDPHFVPRILARARAGRLAIVGDGSNEVSLTWIDNAVRAHLAAARSLAPDAPHAGRAYFVAQRDPVRLWDWIGALIEAAGLPAPTRRLTRSGAMAIGAACELLWKATGRRSDPPLTRFVASQLAATHTYSLEPARRDFGYEETVTTAEATERLQREVATV